MQYHTNSCFPFYYSANFMLTAHNQGAVLTCQWQTTRAPTEADSVEHRPMHLLLRVEKDRCQHPAINADWDRTLCG